MSVEIQGLTLDLPIYTASARSLRKKIMPTTVGGTLFSKADSTVVVRALHNINLTIRDGERVALIGPNGAGKSTLLKTLAGVYTPSAGNVTVNGKVSAALNNSIGIDLEVTGRENIYLMGYYRGLKKAEIDAAVDDIIAVADIGQFINLPMNTYSTGMSGRLTFAIATAFEPDVLLMDEWLGAGDGAFINKAHERTIRFVERARILILASHSLEIVRSFCTHAAYLQRGQLIGYGPTEEMLERYEQDIRSVPAS